MKIRWQGVFYEEYSALIRKEHAEFLPYNTRYPNILLRKSWATKLIIKHNHELEGHSMGTNRTLSSKYWILAAGEAISSGNGSME